MSRQRVLPSQQSQQQQQYGMPGAPDTGPSSAYNPNPGAGSGPQQPHPRQQGNHAHPPGRQMYADYVPEGVDPFSNGTSAATRPRRERRDRDRDGGPGGPPAMSAQPSSTSTRSARNRDVFEVDEEKILKLYNLSSLQPDAWEDASVADGNDMTSIAGSHRRQEVGPKTLTGQDEPDPLGLYRGSILSHVGDASAETRAAILLQSKSFSPKAFLNTVHPGATQQDLRQGRENLRRAIESRSGALQRLVEDNFDRFITIKAATSMVYEEMQAGPLSETGDYSVAELKEAIRLAQNKADTVWNPILEARLKADRLRSTLGVFERSKFFFTLPGTLNEAIAAGRYDAALVAYKKGKYLLDSRPGALLGLPPGTLLTEAQNEKHRRVFEKIWGQVEKIMSDLRQNLTTRLRDPRRTLEEVEKIIEILLEFDQHSDPVWIFFDTQHQNILQVLRASASITSAKFSECLRKLPQTDETSRALDIRRCVKALDTPGAEATLDRSAGAEAWKVAVELVHSLCAIMEQTLPNFLKVAKAYSEGKYMSRESSRSAATSSHGKTRANRDNRRGQSQVKIMVNDMISCFVSLVSDFFTLSPSLGGMNTRAESDPTPQGGLPRFFPPTSNAVTAGTFLLRALSELTECVDDLGALSNLGSEGVNVLREFMLSIRSKATEAICVSWVRDAKIFYRLEEWVLDNDDLSKTIYLRRMVTYQRQVARLAYRSSGGNEERSSHLFITSPAASAALASLRRNGRDDGLPSEAAKRIHSAYLDALYAFLDGLVHVAFSPPMLLPDESEATAPASMAITRSRSRGPTLEGKKLEELNIQDKDVRILLTVSNLSHIRDDLIGRVAEQLTVALKADMGQDTKTLTEVVAQLDKILFDDYVKGHSAQLGYVIQRGVLGEGVVWHNAPKPTEVHPYIYDALLSLVLVHAQVTAIARSLVTRTVGALVEEVAKHALGCFKQVRSFDMGGMLQATLEMEFLHQTLNVHVSPAADATLQEIYKIISHAYSPPTSSSGGAELQRELEQLKMTLTQARRATALQFLCFREKRPQATPTGSQQSQHSDPAATSGRER